MVAMVLATGASAIVMVGCNVFADIKTWQPVGLAAFNSIITLLETVGIINPGANLLITDVRTAFADLLVDITNYQSITPPPVGALAKIQDTLSLIVGNVETLLAQLAVGMGTVVTLITGLANIFLSTIAAFQGQLPAPPLAARQFQIAKQTVTYTAKKRSVGQFRHDWNSAAVAGGHPELQLK
jgi:hypothetical protein